MLNKRSSGAEAPVGRDAVPPGGVRRPVERVERLERDAGAASEDGDAHCGAAGLHRLDACRAQPQLASRCASILAREA